MLNAADQLFVEKLRAAVPGLVFLEIGERYLTEPRGLAQGKAGVIVAPETTGQVSAILSLCNAHSIPVIPYGGGTGLALGQVFPDGPEPLVLSMERMNRIEEVDAGDNVIVVQAGAILADIQTAAEAADRLFPLSLASEGSCRIGGNLATNAGGVNVLRYGNARDLCLGVEAVLADGTVVGGLKRLRKDNTGYDIRNLLIGSEGTLGIITRAALRLFPRPRHQETIFAEVPDLATALRLLRLMEDALGTDVTSFELIHRNSLLFLEETGMAPRNPLALMPEWMVLAEAGSGRPLREAMLTVLEQAVDAGLIGDAVLAETLAQREDLWRVRESIPDANRLIGAIASHDISVPISKIGAFIPATDAALARFAPDIRVNCFGHLGDGNLHYNLFPPKGRKAKEFIEQREELRQIVYNKVAAFDGSFSAEHGIGRLKTGQLQHYGDPGRLVAMRAIKQALDPKGIMNPGVIIAQSD